MSGYSPSACCLLDDDISWHATIVDVLMKIGFEVHHLSESLPASAYEGIVLGIGHAEFNPVVPECIDTVQLHLAQRRWRSKVQNRFLLFDPFLIPFGGFDASLTLQEKKRKIASAGAVLIDDVSVLREAVRMPHKPLSDRDIRRITRPALSKEAQWLRHELRKRPSDDQIRRQAKKCVEEARDRLSGSDIQVPLHRDLLDVLEFISNIKTTIDKLR